MSKGDRAALQLMFVFLGIPIVVFFAGTLAFPPKTPEPLYVQATNAPAPLKISDYKWQCVPRSIFKDKDLYEAAEQYLKSSYGSDEFYRSQIATDPCAIRLAKQEGDWAVLDLYVPAGDPGTWWFHKCKSGWHPVTGGTWFGEWSGSTCDGHHIPRSLWPANLWKVEQ